MAHHDFDALFRSLKGGKLTPCYYLHGAEHQLKDEAIEAILDRTLDPSLRDFNLDLRSGSTFSPNELSTLCSTLPMMAEHRAIVIRDSEAWNRKSKAKTAALAYLDHPAPDTILILVQTGDGPPDAELAKRSYSVELATLPPDRAARWVQHRAKSLDLQLTDDAVTHLVSVLEANLGAIAAELGKLSGLADTGPLDVDRVGSLLGVRHGETQFDWRDAVLDGDLPRATALLAPVLSQSGVSGVRLVALLGSTLVGVGLGRTLYDQRKRGRALESALFNAIRKARLWGIDYKETARLWSQWADRWPAPRIREALRHTRWADEALKSTTISTELGILTDLVLRLHHREKVAA